MKVVGGRRQQFSAHPSWIVACGLVGKWGWKRAGGEATIFRPPIKNCCLRVGGQVRMKVSRQVAAVKIYALEWILGEDACGLAVWWQNLRSWVDSNRKLVLSGLLITKFALLSELFAIIWYFIWDTRHIPQMCSLSFRDSKSIHSLS